MSKNLGNIPNRLGLNHGKKASKVTKSSSTPFQRIQDKIKELERSLEKQRNQNEKIQDNVKGFEQRLEEQYDQSEKMQDEMKDLKQCLEEQFNRNEKIQDTTKELELALGEQYNQNEKMQDKIKDLERCLEEQHDQSGKIQDVTKELERALGEQYNQNEKMQDKIKDLERRLEEQHDQSGKIQDATKELERALQEHYNQNEKMQDKIKDLERRLEEQYNQNEMIQKTRDQRFEYCNGKIEKLDESVQNLTNWTSQLKDRIDEDVERRYQETDNINTMHNVQRTMQKVLATVMEQQHKHIADMIEFQTQLPDMIQRELSIQRPFNPEPLLIIKNGFADENGRLACANSTTDCAGYITYWRDLYIQKIRSDAIGQSPGQQSSQLLQIQYISAPQVAPSSERQQSGAPLQDREIDRCPGQQQSGAPPQDQDTTYPHSQKQQQIDASSPNLPMQLDAQPFPAAQSQQPVLNPHPKQGVPPNRGRIQQRLLDSVCGNCGQSGHELKWCKGPVNKDRFIDGCPKCNSSRHTYVQCSMAATNNSPLRHFLLRSRNNKPPLIYPKDSRNEEYWQFELRSARNEKVEPRRPWTVDFSKQFQINNPRYWENESFHESVIVDPAWENKYSPPPYQGGSTDGKLDKPTSTPGEFYDRRAGENSPTCSRSRSPHRKLDGYPANRRDRSEASGVHLS
ncbi:hypothetical protein EAF00_011646 [Botryotinia globosa]|nr:hypothetical protein EAF00_011646 [Botryotinia globosa]